MRSKFLSFFTSLLLVVSFGAPIVADAWWSSRHYYHRGHRVCKWVPGHWSHGHYVKKHRVCWYRR